MHFYGDDIVALCETLDVYSNKDNMTGDVAEAPLDCEMVLPGEL